MLCFGVNFYQTLLNKKFQKRIFFMLNNYTAATRLLESLGCSYFLTLTNANSTENISVNYTFCAKIRKKSINKISLKIYV